jgi:glutaredoxin-related protein
MLKVEVELTEVNENGKEGKNIVEIMDSRPTFDDFKNLIVKNMLKGYVHVSMLLTGENDEYLDNDEFIISEKDMAVIV